MADTKKPAASTEQGRRNIKIGYVVSTKMDKTIVVKVDMLKAHPLYKRTIKRSKNDRSSAELARRNARTRRAPVGKERCRHRTGS